MHEVRTFGLVVLLVAAAFALAVLSSRLSERVSLPGPALFLLAAAVLSDVFPSLGKLQIRTVERIGVVALIVILFDGGMHIGWRRFRAAAVPPRYTSNTSLRVLGTLRKPRPSTKRMLSLATTGAGSSRRTSPSLTKYGVNPSWSAMLPVEDEK